MRKILFTIFFCTLFVYSFAQPTTGAVSVSGATGTGGAFIVGNTVTAQWDNTVDAGITAVTVVEFDFSEFGGPPNVLASDIGGGVWEATYDITVPGTTESTTADVTVTVTGTGGGSIQDDEDNTVDDILPSVLSINREAGQANPTNGATALFTVTFSESVSGIDVGDFAVVVASGSVASASVASVSAATGTTIDVTINTGTGEGDLRLDFDASASGGVDDAAGNTSTADRTGDELLTVDTQLPTVLTINREAGQADPTNGATALFTVTFSEAVTGIDVGDFVVVVASGSITGESVASVSAASGTTIDVTINTGTGEGDLRLDFDASASGGVDDAIGNTSTADKTGDETVTYDDVLPTVLSINREAGQANPTNGATALFTVTFSEAVSGIDVGDFAVVVASGSITGESVASVSSASGTSIDVTINTGTGEGDLRLDFDASASGGVDDVIGNTSTADRTGDETVTFDDVLPTVLSINREAGQSNPTNGATALFTVTFSEPVTGIDIGDFAVAVASGSVAGASIASVSSASGTTIDVTINTGTGEGDLRLDFDASASGGVDDAAGNTSTADRTGDELLTVDTQLPTVLTINREAGQADPTNGATALFTVTFSEAVTGIDVGDFAVVVASGSITGESVASVSAASGTTIDVTINTGTGEGDLRLDFDASASGGVDDAIGNTSTADKTGDETVTYDDVLPTVLSINREAGQANPTNGATALFTVTFSEAVSGIDVGDFAVVVASGSITGESVASVSSASGTSIDVTINTGTGEGDLRLDFDASASGGVDDVIGNTSTADRTGDETVTFDDVLPTFVDATFYDWTGDGSIDEILIEMSEPIDESSIETADFLIDGSGATFTLSPGGSPSVDNSDDVSTSDEFFTLEVDLGTTDDLALEYLQDNVNNELSDFAGNEAADDNAIPQLDLAAPVLTDIQFEDQNDDGIIDLVTYVFSEIVFDIAGGLIDDDIGTVTMPDGSTFDGVGGNQLGDANVSLTNDGSFGYLELDVDGAGYTTVGTDEGSIDVTGSAPNFDDDQGLVAVEIVEGIIDLAKPRIMNVAITANSYADVTFSEPVYSDMAATNPVAASNFAIDITSVVGESVLSVRNTTAIEFDDAVNVLTGGETVIRLFFTFTPPNTGGETVTINTDGNIFDAENNTADATQFPTDNQDALIAPSIPNLSEVIWLDQNGDGMIDAVSFTFDIDWDIDEPGGGDTGDGLDCFVITNGGVPVTQDGFDYDEAGTNGSGFYDAGTFETLTFGGDEQPGTSVANLLLTYVTNNDRIESQSTEDDAVNGDTPEVNFDGAPPRFVNFSATVLDDDADGNVDRIEVQAQDNIDDSQIDPSEFTYNGVAATGVASFDDTDQSFTLLVNGSGTGVEGDFVYTPGTMLLDTANNLSNGGTINAASITDGAGPVILDAETRDTDATPNGQIDEIVVTFSENLANIFGNAGSFTVNEGGDVYTVTAANPTAGDEVTLSLTEGAYTGGPSGPLDTYITPDVSITAGFGDDAAGALTPAQTFTNTSDGAAPLATVTPLITDDASPDLAGNLDDPNATILINVSGNGDVFTRSATNNGDGTWAFTNTGSAPAGFTLSQLGTYEVTTISVDLTGNTGTDGTNNELTINGGANITPATPAAICTSDGYVPLGQIEIDEGNDGDFASSGSILLTLPEGFEFDTSIPANFGSSSLSDISVISGTYIGTASIRIDITVTGGAGDDIVRIDDLEVTATLGGQTSVVLERTGGDASLLTTDTDYAVLTSNSAPSSISSLDETIGGDADITELSIISGTTFSLDATDQGPATLNWYENVVDGTPEFVGPIATQANLNSSEGLHSYFLRNDDGTCESQETIFNLLVYTYSDNGTNDFTTRTFRSADDPDTMVFSNPANHTVTVSGSGIVANISEPGTLKAVFDPSTVSEGSYVITYQVTNSIGESQSVFGTFTVEALSDLIQEFRRNGIADVSPGEDFCEVDILSFDADLSEVSALASAYFFRFSFLKTSGPGVYTTFPIAFDPVAGASYPADPNQSNGAGIPASFPLAGHNPNTGWDLDLSTLDPGATYDVYLDYNRIGDGARASRRVFSLFVQPLPEVEIAEFGDQCENDNTTYQLEARVNGVTGPLTNGYDLEFFNGISWVPEFTSPDEDFNPFDLQISQGGSGPGQYRVVYESTPQGDGQCTNTNINEFTLFPTPGEPFLNASHDLSWRGAPWINTADNVNGFDSYVMEFCSENDVSFIVGEDPSILYNWYADDQTTILQPNQWFISGGLAFDDPATGGVVEEPTAGTETIIYFSTFENGCESALRKITIYIYEDTDVPEPTAASLSANGELFDTNHYIFDYCDTYDPIILEAANVGPSNPTSLNPSTYFNLYSEDNILQTTNFLGTDLTSAVLGLSTGNIDTTIYVTQVWNDQTPGAAGTVAQPFEGCESIQTRFDIFVTATPTQPLAGDFVGINSAIIHICEGDAVSNITTSDAGNPDVDEYVWYDNNGAGGVGAEMVRKINGGQISQAEIEANSLFDPNVVGQYSFFVSKISGLNENSSFIGCETAFTEFIIEVHLIDDTDFPMITSSDYTDIGDGEFDRDLDADHLFPVCITELDPLATLDAASAFGGVKEFVWYESNATFSTQAEILTSTNPTFDQLGMGIGDITGAQSKYFIVTQRLDIDDFPVGQGCESGLATTYLEVRFSDLSALTMNVENPGLTPNSADWCYDEANPTFDLLVGGASVNTLPQPGGGTQDPNAQIRYAVLLNNSVLSDTLDVMGVPVQGAGNITTDFFNWHVAKSGNTPDGGGNIVGGLSSTHYILMEYTDPATNCVGSEIFTLTVHPDPPTSIFIDGIDQDQVEFVYDDSNIDLAGFNYETDLGLSTNQGSFTILPASGALGVTNNNQSSFDPSTAHDFVSGANPEFAPQSSHVINFNYTDEFGCVRDTTRTVFVNPVPEILDNEIKTANTCADNDVELFVDVIPNEFGEGIEVYDIVWEVNGNVEQSLTAGTADANILFFDLAPLGGQANFSVFLTYNPGAGSYNTAAQSSVEGQSIVVGEAPTPAITWVGTTANNPTGTDFRITEDNAGLPDADLVYLEFFVDGISEYIQDEAVPLTPDIAFPLDLNYNFTTAGTHTVRVVMETSAGCTEIFDRNVEIIDHIPGITTYTEDFESGAGGWTVETLSLNGKASNLNTSWVIGTNPPGGDSGDGTNSVYTDGYDSAEVSFIYSPSLDLRSFNAPTISFLRYEDFETFRDGVVFQLSTDDGRTWINVGSYEASLEEEGLASSPNWYNTEAISSGPGADSPGPQSNGSNVQGFGWAEQNDWAVAISPLDNIPAGEEEFVRFRFALAAQATPKTTNGFAFDLVQIYDQDQIVLIEQFSSSLDLFSVGINNLIDDADIFEGNDIIRINYFTDFANNGTESDELNQRNTAAPGARSSYYGIENVPSMVISGDAQLIDDPALLTGKIAAQLRNAKLDLPGFEINFTGPDGGNPEISADNILTVGATFTAISELPDEDTQLGLFLTIIEPQIIVDSEMGDIGLYVEDDTITNVLRVMLPGPAGQLEEGAVLVNDVLNIADTTWTVSSMYDPDTLAIVAYVQNLTTKQVLQSAIYGMTNPNAEPALGTNELAEVSLYPNPANQQVTLEFSEVLTQETNWVIYDQLGREVYKGVMSPGTRTMTVQTADVPSGLYFLHLYAEDRKRQTKRIIVVH